MIFDPELAAAARRHARAQAKSNKQAAATAAAVAAAASAATTTATPHPNDGDAGGKFQEGGGATGGEVAAASVEALNAGSVDNGDHGAWAKVFGRGERAGSTTSATGNADGVGHRSRAGSAAADSLEGVERVGPVGPKAPRAMKPRVLLKIIVLGCSNVGKTSLMKRYASNDFTERRRPTIGADFMTKEIVAGDQPMLLQVWDTAGQERFHGGSLGSGFYRGANAALLVYDVACALSFEQVAMWREELLVRLDVDPHDFPIVVIGNKVDLAQGLPMDGVNGVDKSRVLKWCNMQHMGHIETSAKDGTGVEAAMQAVAMSALDQKRKREKELLVNPTLGGGTTLDMADERARQLQHRGCC